LGFSGIAEQNRKVWNDAYPSANIDAELAKAHAWLIAHPDRAGKRNWAAFLTRWLGRAHEGASVRGARQGAATLARIGDGSYASERVKIRRLDAGGEGAGESGTH
jgi:hypothetical protein